MTFDPIAARRHFPSLHRPSPRGQTPIFFDNPAGTQVAQQVIDGVTHYFLTMNANSGGEFATSQRSDAMVEGVRKQAQAFLNAPRHDDRVRREYDHPEFRPQPRHRQDAQGRG